MKYVFISGVSSGIGYDAVRYLTSKGYFVFGSVRKPADKQRLENDFPERFKCVLFDTLDRDAIKTAAAEVQAELDGQLLTCLVANAGIAVACPLEHVDNDAFDHQLLVNVSGTRNVINAFLPMLGASLDRPANLNPGKIILNSSISGVLNTPINGSYCISKHAVESLGEVYRRELYPFGIDVLSIQSGPIQSEIWNKNAGALDEFMETDYATMAKKTNEILIAGQESAQPAETISKLIDRIIENKRPKLAYIVHSKPWLICLLSVWLPARMVDRLIVKKLSS